jgi:hypothetical protein
VGGRQWQLHSYKTLGRSWVRAPEAASELERVRLAGSEARGSSDLLWWAGEGGGARRDEGYGLVRYQAVL